MYSNRNAGFRVNSENLDIKDYNINKWHFVVYTGAGTSPTSYEGTTQYYIGDEDTCCENYGTSDRVVSGTTAYTYGLAGQGPGLLASFTYFDRVLTLDEIKQQWQQTGRSERSLGGGKGKGKYITLTNVALRKDMEYEISLWVKLYGANITDISFSSPQTAGETVVDQTFGFVQGYGIPTTGYNAPGKIEKHVWNRIYRVFTSTTDTTNADITFVFTKLIGGCTMSISDVDLHEAGQPNFGSATPVYTKVFCLTFFSGTYLFKETTNLRNNYEYSDSKKNGRCC
jgi:hypothetical protein